LLPAHRLCGFVGYPGALGQGRLGIGAIEDRMAELHDTCAPFGVDRAVMPVMELIAVTVQPQPGPDGMWRDRVDPAIIDEWLSVAREHGALLLLDIQPGQAEFLDEVKVLERYLVQPDVGVALDPEWSMGPGQIPMQSFGSTSGEELDQVAAYLSDLVTSHDLPEKPMVYHILHPSIITNEDALQPHQVSATVPPHVHMGFKLFFDEDMQTSGVLMSPDEVLALSPVPDYVLYE